ncbi:universal stress protein [Hymenobacter persicinus]|nr:universal stress protein [Hymenobacter persicinus]
MTPSLVVLTDFLAVSNRALDYAAALAVPLGGHLVLLHVPHDGLLAPEEYGHRHSRSAERQTEHELLKLAAAQPVPAEVDVSEQFLPDAVQEAVRRHNPLLLVLGRPGSASTPAEMVTITVMDLLRHASYPLLVVPTLGWDTAPPHRLLLAVDGQPFRLCAHQDVVRQLLQATQGTLEVVHVTDDEHAVATPAAVLASVRHNHLVDHLPDSSLHHLYQPTVMGGVLQRAADLQADLLVVVARRHSLLGSLFHRSVTARLLQESPIPVLLLPAED